MRPLITVWTRGVDVDAQRLEADISQADGQGEADTSEAHDGNCGGGPPILVNRC